MNTDERGSGNQDIGRSKPTTEALRHGGELRSRNRKSLFTAEDAESAKKTYRWSTRMSADREIWTSEHLVIGKANLPRRRGDTENSQGNTLPLMTLIRRIFTDEERVVKEKECNREAFAIHWESNVRKRRARPKPYRWWHWLHGFSLIKRVVRRDRIMAFAYRPSARKLFWYAKKRDARECSDRARRFCRR